jgi:SAM-dependent methyltransferase
MELPKQQSDLFADVSCREAGVVIEQEWNERYAGSNQIWSGQPNQALVTEVSELRPGRALDVGCGEGADAVWLAQRGWAVTGLDVSGVALDRARLHARDAGVVVRWVRAGLVEAGLPDRSFDLISAQEHITPGTSCCGRGGSGRRAEIQKVLPKADSDRGGVRYDSRRARPATDNGQ